MLEVVGSCWRLLAVAGVYWRWPGEVSHREVASTLPWWFGLHGRCQLVSKQLQTTDQVVVELGKVQHDLEVERSAVKVEAAPFEMCSFDQFALHFSQLHAV